MKRTEHLGKNTVQHTAELGGRGSRAGVQRLHLERNRNASKSKVKLDTDRRFAMEGGRQAFFCEVGDKARYRVTGWIPVSGTFKRKSTQEIFLKKKYVYNSTMRLAELRKSELGDTSVHSQCDFLFRYSKA